MKQEIHTQINNLEPIEILTLLMQIGIEVNETDMIGDLREAVRQNVEDGTLDASQLP